MSAEQITFKSIIMKFFSLLFGGAALMLLMSFSPLRMNDPAGKAPVAAAERAADKDALVLLYTVSKANRTITLPLIGKVDCSVDWGDGGDVQTVTSKLPTHTYQKGGTYSVSVTGTVTAINSKPIATVDEPNTTLVAVKQWGSTGLTNMNDSFMYNTKLASLPEDTDGAFNDVKSFSYAFRGCSSLKTVPKGLFAGCSSCTCLTGVFHSCESLKQLPEGLFDDCVNVEETVAMFTLCTSLNSIPNGLFDSFSKAKLFDNAFNGCSSLKSVPEGLFDKCTSVTSFRNAFINCPGLTDVPVNLFDNCKEVTNFTYTFSGCALKGESPYTVVDGKKVHIYERTADLGFAIPTEFKGCFGKCSALDDYSDIPSSWGGGK